MKPRRTSLVCVLLLAAGAAYAEPVSVPALGPRFKQTRERIDVLFQYRNGTYALPDPLMNPFRSGETVATQSTPEVKRDPLPADSDDAVLRRAMAVLKLGGVVKPTGVAYLMANLKPYEKGDTIPVKIRSDKTVSLLVKDVTPVGFTLSYNTAEIYQTFASLKQ